MLNQVQPLAPDALLGRNCFDSGPEPLPKDGKVGAAMKSFIAIAVFFWFLCGLIGAWRMEGLDDLQIKSIGRGPITLIQAYKGQKFTLRD
jgi:hypothetical protein